jgi:hypothetical protein
LGVNAWQSDVSSKLGYAALVFWNQNMLQKCCMNNANKLSRVALCGLRVSACAGCVLMLWACAWTPRVRKTINDAWQV